MVAGQIGEGGGRDRDAVEAELVETVARRLDRDMVDACRGECRELAVERRPGRASSAPRGIAPAGVTIPSVPRLAAA